MSSYSCVIRRCECSTPHKDGAIVVRVLHSNKRQWACRLCPHYSTLAAAIAGAKMKKLILAIGEALTADRYLREEW